MKKLFILFVVVLTSLGVYAQKKTNSPNAQKKPSTQTAKATQAEVKSVISLNDGYADHLTKARITQKDREDLKINSIVGDGFIGKDAINSTLAKGKLVYQDDKGTLQTILQIVPDHATFEYLISYNAEGAYVDCLKVGTIMNYAGDRGASKMTNKKVTYISTYPEGDDKGYRQYEITSDLKFKKVKEWRK